MPIDRFFKDFSPQPLEGGDANYVDLFKVRGDNPINSLKYRLLDAPRGKQHILFSGFTGCGKSTELNKLSKHLATEHDFVVVHLDVVEDIDPANVSYVDLIPLAMEKLADAAEKLNIPVDDDLVESIKHWKNSEEIKKINVFTKGAEAEAAVEGKGSLFWLVKFSGALRSNMRYSQSAKKTITEIIEPRISVLIAYCNVLIREIKANLSNVNKKGLLMVIENMDKLRKDKAEALFFDNSNILTALQTNIIYTFPIALRHSDRNTIISSKFSESFRLPMVKVFEKDGSYYEPGRKSLKEVILKRLENKSDDFESEELILKFINKSGGVIRDLFRMLKAAADNALNNERTLIVQADYLYAVNRLKSDYEGNLAERRSDNEEDVIIATEDIYQTLKNLIESKTKTIDNNLVTLSLLQNMSILGYNGEGWYDAHPIVKDILSNHGKLD